MNQVRNSSIQKYPKGSQEHFVVRSLCRQDFFYETENVTNAPSESWELFHRILVEVNATTLCKELNGMFENKIHTFNEILNGNSFWIMEFLGKLRTEMY